MAVRRRLAVCGAMVLLAAVLFSPPGPLAAAPQGLRDVLGPGFPPSLAEEAEGIFRSLVLAQGEEESLRQIMKDMVSSGYPGEAIPSCLRLVQGLISAGIGVQDLVSKVEEGLAKKISPPRVMVVAEDRARRLKEARAVVLDLENQGIAFLDQQMGYRVLADYLARGIPADDLKRRIQARDLSEYPALDNILK